jgi:plastocyanin domain-containing protein
MMEKIGIVIGGALLVGFILWWFFGKRTTSEAEAKVVDDGQAVTVAVDGGYTPNTVVLKKRRACANHFRSQRPIKLSFARRVSRFWYRRSIAAW